MAPNRGTFEEQRSPSSLLNRSSLVPKLFTLLYSAGTTTLMPFLPMYFRQLGMTAFQSGILGSFPAVVQCLSFPVWQLVAERTNKRKCFLLLMILAGIVLNVSLGLVRREDAYLGAYKCEFESNETVKFPALGGNFSTAPQVWNKNTSRDHSAYSDPTQTGNDFATLIATSTSSEDTEATLQSSKLKRHIYNNSQLHGQLTKTISSESGDLNDSQILNRSHTRLYQVYGFRMDHTFSALALLLFFCALLTPVSAVADSMFSDVLYRHTNLHFTRKVWMSLGILCGGGAITVVVGQYHCSFGLQNSFYLHFYLFSLFGAGAFCLALLLQVSESKAPLRLRFGLMCNLICCDMNVLCFMAVLWVAGIAESLISNFLMWYLQDIHTSLTLMGFSMLLMAFSEIVMHGLSYYLLHWCGHHWLMFFSLIVYGSRFLCFSYITNPILAVLVQLLHGFSYTASLSACKSCAGSVSLPGMDGRVYTLLSFVYLGLGRGLGGIAAALLYHLYGPLVVFRCAAGVCGLYSLCFAFLHCLVILPNPDGRRKSKKLIQYQHITLDDDEDDDCHQVDWLLEALEAEELSEFTR